MTLSVFRRPARWLALLAALAAADSARAWWDDGTVPYVVSPQEVVHRMLRIAEVGPGDRLIDLGSGDGRVVIGAAKRGAQALGVEIDPELVVQARENAVRAGVAGRARFEHRDLFETDLSQASVVTMYLLPEFNLKLMPRLLALAPGTRVVSHDWDMGAWLPDETLSVRAPDKPVGGRDGLSYVHLWIVPAQAAGAWRGRVEGLGGEWRIRIRQTHQMLEVEADESGRELVVRASRLRGREIKLVVSGLVGGRPMNLLLAGRVEGARIEGRARTFDGQTEDERKWIATRIQ
ncbi:MAG TPA: methyltransferase domain-containing protein [Burkholderiales bacterium]|nr:methyltransferase domain-containing protein [Burkholderiales bacterium]